MAATGRGRLTARPQARLAAPDLVAPGLQPLGLGRGRAGLLCVPPGYDADRPAPLLLMLHGAGGIAAHVLEMTRFVAEALGVLILAPESRDRTWDVILGGYGPDVRFIDRALAATFERFAVDPARLAVGGFSDGASYALSLGLMNGNLFSDVLAFSPGFMAPESRHGRPRVFVSHGTNDTVLPIAPTSRSLAPKLRQAGYDLDYREFDGGHVVPPELVRAAFERFVAG